MTATRRDPIQAPLAFAALVFALLGASLASVAHLSEDVDDTLIPVGVLVATVAVLYAWVATGRRFAAQALALVQGAVWFVLLIHGGWGIVLAPVAWLATVVAARFPVIATGLLVAPVIVLLLSWWPILSENPSISDSLVFAALVAPASVAAALLLVSGGGTRQTTSALRR